MHRDPRSALTPAQRDIFDNFERDPGAVAADEIPPAVLRALDQQHRPTGVAATADPGFLRRRVLPNHDVLVVADAAQLLGISHNTFARSVAKAVASIVVDGKTVYRRTDLEAWKAQRFAARKRPPSCVR